MAEKKEKSQKTENTGKMLGAILIRGIIGANNDVKDTLKMLNIGKKHSCAIMPDNSVNRGMLHKCKDYITYGEVSSEVIKELEQKRQKKQAYNLNSPRGGFERKGTKTPFTAKGALGYRGEKINDLIRKMI